MSLIDLSNLHRHVAHLRRDAALPFDEGIVSLQGLQEARVAVGNDQLQVLAQKAPPLEVGDKALPSLGVLYLGELERKQFPAALCFSRPGLVDAEGHSTTFLSMPISRTLLLMPSRKRNSTVSPRGLVR